jgi:cyclic beta-1,2-glucan synthetase
MSESGQAYTWSENAHEFRLTPWENDPVMDRGGEAFYLRDEHTGVFWSPTALPAPSGADYLTRHGFGYSVFEHSGARHPQRAAELRGAGCAAQIYGAQAAQRQRRRAPVRHRLRRMGAGRPARQVGDARGDRARPGQRRPVRAQCLQHRVFGRVAFFHLDAEHVGHTCDRAEFIGRNRSLAQSGGAGAGRPVRPLRRGARPVRGAAGRLVELQPGEETRAGVHAGRGRTAQPGRFRHGPAPQRQRAPRPTWPRCARTGTTRSARCASRPRNRRSTRWPTAG